MTNKVNFVLAVRLAKLKANKVFTAPCDTSVLYPTTGGNIHEFTAITPCAVLDVIGPPYSKEDGRDCSYYKDYPYNAFPSESLHFLIAHKRKLCLKINIHEVQKYFYCILYI